MKIKKSILFYKSTSHHDAIGAKIRHIAKFPILNKFSKKNKNNQFLINEILKLQKIKNRTFNYFNLWLKWAKMSFFWLNIHSSLVFGTKSQVSTGLKWKISNLAQWNFEVEIKNSNLEGGQKDWLAPTFFRTILEIAHETIPLLVWAEIQEFRVRDLNKNWRNGTIFSKKLTFKKKVHFIGYNLP